MVAESAPAVASRLRFECFRVLGPVELVCQGGVAEIGSAKVRALLSALLLRANRFVPSAHLAEALWGEEPPPTHRTTLHSHVMRLRHLLERHGCAGAIRTESAGYLIGADPDMLDLLMFERFVARGDRARQDADPVGELMALTSACGLWAGPPLANVDSDLLHRQEVPRLAEALQQARERRIDVGLTLGRHAEFLGELRELTTRFPHRERFWAQLMEAYWLGGRQSEALSAYQTARRLLAEEVGVEPGPELRAVHERILRGESVGRAAPAQEITMRAAPLSGMCQLPLDVPGFVGRSVIVGELTDLLAGDADRGRGQLAVLHGGPVIGKTAVAVRVAYQLRQRFPDGQWFVPLGGSAGSARPPGEVLGDLLHSAGLRAEDMPPGESARAALLRASLAERAVLLVLDDAASLSQVEPLLPGAGRCRALITSRCRLRGLGALYGASIRRLPPLRPDESLQLLQELAGPRITDTSAAQSLARLCGHVPFALRIAAATLDARRELDLAAFVAGLACPDRLERLALPGDQRLSMRAVIASAYESLGPGAQRMLCVLASRPGQVSLEQAATALELPAGTAEEALAALIDAGLVDEEGPDLSVPELIRLFAAQVTETTGWHGDGATRPPGCQAAATTD